MWFTQAIFGDLPTEGLHRMAIMISQYYLILRELFGLLTETMGTQE